MLFNGTFLTLIGVMSPPPPPLCNTYLSGCLFLSLSMCIPIPHPISSPGTWIRTCLIQLNAVVLKVGGRGLLLFQYLFFICPTVRIFFHFFWSTTKTFVINTSYKFWTKSCKCATIYIYIWLGHKMLQTYLHSEQSRNSSVVVYYPLSKLKGAFEAFWPQCQVKR